MRADAFERMAGRALAEAMPPGARRVVVAVSGGPDSMALLHALHAFSARTRAGWELHVAHLNHGLRGAEAEADADFVRAAAGALGLPFTLERADLTWQARPGATLEEAARRARYAFLERVAVGARAAVVAVAHHADDQAETVLHRIVRGTGLRGLAGMAACRPMRARSRVRLVRPLLGVRRADVLAYLGTRRIAYRQDATNVLLDRARNRVRHRVLPVLRAEMNARADEALVRLAEQARWTEAFLRDTARAALREARMPGKRGSVALNARRLAGEARIVRTRVVLEVLRKLKAPEKRIRFAHLREAAALVHAGPAKKRVELPGGFSAVRVRDVLWIGRAADVDAAVRAPAAVTRRGRRLVVSGRRDLP